MRQPSPMLTVPSWLRVVPAMEGEWLLGHLRRVAILNNCKVRHFVNVSEEYPPIIGATFTRLVARFILGLLAGASGKRHLDYIIGTSLFGIVYKYTIDYPSKKQLEIQRLPTMALFMSHCGLLTDNATAKQCSLCRSEDIWRHGFSWYRRDHQLAGVDRCFEHDVALELFSFDHTGAKATSKIDHTENRQSESVSQCDETPPEIRSYVAIMKWVLSGDVRTRRMTAQRVLEARSGKWLTEHVGRVEGMMRDNSTRRWMSEQFQGVLPGVLPR